MSLTIKHIHDDDGFNSVRNEWKSFETQEMHKNLSSAFDWLYTWWEIFKDVNNNEFGHNKELVILFLYDNDKLVAIFPLVKLYKKYLIKYFSFIEFLGQQWLATFLDIIGNNLTREHVAFLFDWLKKNVTYDIIFLKHIPECTVNFHRDSLFPFAGCPELSLSSYSGNEDYIKQCYSKNLKQNLKTALNKIGKNNLILAEYTDNINDDTMKDVVRISASKLTDGKMSKYTDPLKLAFIRQMGDQVDSNIAFIKFNDENVAYRLNFIYNHVKTCVDASYSRDYKNFDVGAMSVNLNIRDSFEKKLNIHSEGPGLEFYKLKFIKSFNTMNLFIARGNKVISALLYLLMKQLVIRKSKQYLQEASTLKKS
jgi:hypothetical protein